MSVYATHLDKALKIATVNILTKYIRHYTAIL